MVKLVNQQTANNRRQCKYRTKQCVGNPYVTARLRGWSHFKNDVWIANCSAGIDTSDQRRMVIILVLDQDENTNIDQSLRSAMAGESVRAPIFEALLTKYSLGNADRFTWVP